ncbi:MAG: type II toxin-antitoxin system mRNA interferase toxin, RelE/StbE family [Candidatus Fermentibacteria bacterium]|nr:type II toxin-antitoxin system mRNA interferase toxin, RelE/StbE family [Candidatus Fermentibacteria bacterium]
MAYRITFKKSVSRDLKKIDITEADRIQTKISEELSKKAESMPELKGRFSGLRNYRAGEYRIIFTILNDSILITRIRHKKEVCKN